MVVGAVVSGTWSWSRGGEPTGRATLICSLRPEGRSTLSISFTHKTQSIEQVISLQAVPMRFGGWRWYAICPFTNEKCTTLVLPNGGHRFASVKGWRLPYASQNEDDYCRAHRRIAKASKRLEQMSKYARRPTRERQWERIEDGERVLDYGLTLACARIMKLDARLSGARRKAK